MQLSLIPQARNNWPIGGIIIYGGSVTKWMEALNVIDLQCRDLLLYPLPGGEPNSVAGCLIPLPPKQIQTIPTGPWQYFQVVSDNLYIAEFASIFPILSANEVASLFGRNIHFVHPQFGWVELPDGILISSLFELPSIDRNRVAKPQSISAVRETISTFMIAPVAPEDTIEQLIGKRPTERIPEAPLNFLEKLRLSIYELMPKALNIASAGSGLLKNVAIDYENLLERNQAMADKLMKMLRDNPAEALKYAIPVSKENSLSRGDMDASRFDLSKIWSSFSLFQPTSTGGGTIELGDRHYQLIQQYNTTAQKLEEQGAYEDAAFVFLKLLNQPAQAAAVLERGSMNAEAAAIYLHHAHDKQKAALCYEKASMLEAAVNLYKELQQYERVGDMYTQMGQKDLAKTWYNEGVNELLRKADYLAAALLMQNKVQNPERAQLLLLEGWNESTKPTPCLQAYFANIADDFAFLFAVEEIVEGLDKRANQEQFLDVLAGQYTNRPKIAEPLSDIAFAVVARNVINQPSLVAMLRHFSPTDGELLKDAIRYKSMRGKR